MQEKVLNYLKTEPKFRERKSKNRGIVNLLISMYPVLNQIDKDLLTKVVKEYASMDRIWRKILEENENLRGRDYGQKEILEQESMLNLDYRPGYHEDVKQLKML
jgi:hypothetical protein